MEKCSNAQAALTATGSGTRRRRVAAIVELRYDSERNDRKSSVGFGARACGRAAPRRPCAVLPASYYTTTAKPFIKFV
ncbi:unnamed protein product, partial [Brenthis ino]